MKSLLFFFSFGCMFLAKAQNVGIGGTPVAGKAEIFHNSLVADPQLFLTETEVDFARLNFRNTSLGHYWSIAARNSSPTSNDRMNFYNSLTGNLMTITGSGNVGISNSNPVYPLTVNGIINSSTLAGIGTRQVRADPNGSLSAAPLTMYTSIAAYSFIKTGVSGNTITYASASDLGLSLNAGANDVVGSTVELPQGASLVNMKIVYRDNSVNNLDISFGYTNQATIGVLNLGTFTTSGASASNQTSTLALSHTIDNSTRLYIVRISPDAGDTWDGSLLFIKGIIFEYTL